MTSASPTTTAFWRRCSSCKSSIGFERVYWVCNVTTCNRKRTGLVFCTVSCWDAHLSVMRHRDSWSEERRSPTRTDWEREQAEERAKAATAQGSASGAGDAAPAREPQRRIVASAPPPERNLDKEVLVVVSKLKAYVRARADMNTSDHVAELLSDRLRTLCDEAIRRARKEGRKTLMDRDF
ncbi:MAG TPA: hypothetical protein VMW19_11685 [Myxococcota bacterium]|nr:hypothetical protein [Myxococcota bacterium]